MDSKERYEVLKVNDDGTTLVKDLEINKFGIFGTDNELLIPCKYDYIGDFHDGLAPVKKDGEAAFIDKNGNYFFSVAEYQESPLQVKKDGETYYIDTSGKFVDDIDSDKANEQSTGKTL